MKEYNKIIIPAIVIAFLCLGTIFYFYYRYNQENNPNIAAEIETKNLVDKLSKIIELPSSETPTIMTVSDSTKLPSDPFFANAENGDVVFIFNTAMEEILYRPSDNTLIEVAPYIVSTSTVATSSGTQTQSATNSAVVFSVVIENGTNIAHLAKNIGTSLASNQNINILSEGNAVESNYQSTLVVALTSSSTKVAAEIAKDLNGTVSSLPNGETKTKSDILIIVGSSTSAM
jgi:hypothetical protein